jgi:hypothetical protein
MDLLSTIGMVTKRRSDYFEQAKTLAKKYTSQPSLEERMKEESAALVKGLRDKLMRWEEYERSLIDKTLTSALAAVYLGAGDSNPQAKMEKAWPTLIGDMMPPLVNFLNETKTALDDGAIRLGDQTEDFREGIRSWFGLVARVVRYIANPTYSFFDLGRLYVREEQGYREMRRVDRHDSKVCPDCREYSDRGWQPIGSLPMPGRECQCYDHCRCAVEYR